jgi:predicted unusual protein kinase regulating ubiquinone biosynthesis (AarF/ABC1/UbiB family)
MSRSPGSILSTFLKSNPSQDIRDKLGVGLTHLFFFQLFRLKALHADPHPGNYLFNRDGTISLVDFGCVKHLKPQVVRCYSQFWSREWVRDPKIYAGIIRVLFGHKAPSDALRVRRCMNEIRRFYDKFHPLDATDHVLELGESRFMDALAQLAKTLITNKFISADFLFLSRTESGMCNLLHLLGARVPTTAIVRQWMPASI